MTLQTFWASYKKDSQNCDLYSVDNGIVFTALFLMISYGMTPIFKRLQPDDLTSIKSIV